MSAISIWMMTAALNLAQGPAISPARVAVVDIPAVSERYEKTADLEKKFEERRVAYNKEIDSKREQMKRIAQSLQEQLKPGTAEYNERRKQLAMLETDLEWFTESEGQSIEKGLAQSLQIIYADIHDAVREIAEQMRIDVVLAADRVNPEPAPTAAQARQQIVMQKVVYWTPQVDITRVNERYWAEKLNAGDINTAPARP